MAEKIKNEWEAEKENDKPTKIERAFLEVDVGKKPHRRSLTQEVVDEERMITPEEIEGIEKSKERGEKRRKKGKKKLP